MPCIIVALLCLVFWCVVALLVWTGNVIWVIGGFIVVALWFVWNDIASWFE